jgi:hypothetical protein
VAGRYLQITFLISDSELSRSGPISRNPCHWFAVGKKTADRRNAVYFPKLAFDSSVSINEVAGRPPGRSQQPKLSEAVFHF